MERRRTNKKKFWKPPGGKCESVGREAACRLIKFGAPGPVRGASFAFFFTCKGGPEFRNETENGGRSTSLLRPTSPMLPFVVRAQSTKEK